MKHIPTPGPWKVRIDDSEIPPQLQVIRGDGVLDWICDCGHFKNPQCQADARLIAAAPELLEALEKIAKMDGESFPIAFAKCVDAARAAIAKAKSK